MRALQTNLEKTNNFREFNSTLQIVSLISVKGASIEIVEEIGKVGPFGTSNPSPIIAIANCQIKYIKVLTGKHIKFTCSDSTGKRLESIFFNGVETIAGQALLTNAGESFHLCGRLEINDWGGYRRVVLQVEDVATT